MGRGFAVVASEVRALAQRSSEAAKEIRRLIRASSAHVNDGVVQVGEAGASLERIAGHVTEITEGVNEIALTAEEQANGLRELSVAVDQMDSLTQQNAAMAEQATAAARSLHQETAELFSLINEFSVSRSRGAAADAPAPRSRVERARTRRAAPRAAGEPSLRRAGRVALAMPFNEPSHPRFDRSGGDVACQRPQQVGRG